MLDIGLGIGPLSTLLGLSPTSLPVSSSGPSRGGGSGAWGLLNATCAASARIALLLGSVYRVYLLSWVHLSTRMGVEQTKDNESVRGSPENIHTQASKLGLCSSSEALPGDGPSSSRSARARGEQLQCRSRPQSNETCFNSEA